MPRDLLVMAKVGRTVGLSALEHLAEEVGPLPISQQLSEKSIKRKMLVNKEWLP